MDHSFVMRSDTRVCNKFLLKSLLGLLVGIISLGGCQLQQNAMLQRDNDLSAAGFMVKIANTAERQAMLNRLPPNQFVQRSNGGISHYVYADPDCGCLYVGNQQAFDQYMSGLQLDAMHAQQMNLQMFYDAAWNWDAWGPWGPLGPEYGPGLGW